MRISTSQIFRQGISSITSQQTQLAQTQLQLASGKRLLSPADDPAGSTEALRLTERIAVTRQHQENLDFARTRLNQEEGSVARAVEVLQRLRELAISANDSALVRSDREAIAAEVSRRAQELLDVANTRDPSGEYLFSGFQGRTQPFTQDAAGNTTYAGDQGRRVVQIGADHSVVVADSGFDAFVGVRSGNGTFAVSPGASNDGTGTIDPGTVVDATLYDRDTYTVTMAVDSAVTGGAIGITDSGSDDLLSYELRINGVLIDTVSEGGSRTLAALEASIDAQSGATGVQAHVDGGRLFLSNTSAGSGLTITETLVGASEDTDTVTGFFGGNLTGLTTPSVSTDLDGAANAFVVTDSGNNIETSGSFAAGASISFAGIATSVTGAPNQGDAFTVTPSVNQSVFTTVKNLADDLSLGGVELGNAINRALEDLDRGLENFNSLRAEIGARLNVLDTQEEANADITLELQTALSNVEDLDFPEAAARLSQQLVALESAQLAFVRVQSLSLFNFLR